MGLSEWDRVKCVYVYPWAAVLLGKVPADISLYNKSLELCIFIRYVLFYGSGSFIKNDSLILNSHFVLVCSTASFKKNISFVFPFLFLLFEQSMLVCMLECNVIYVFIFFLFELVIFPRMENEKLTQRDATILAEPWILCTNRLDKFVEGNAHSEISTCSSRIQLIHS